MNIKKTLWNLCSKPLYEIQPESPLDSTDNLVIANGHLIAKGKLSYGRVQQCDFNNCQHWQNLKRTGNCPGDPYEQKCKHRKPHDGQYREYGI